MNFLDAFGLVVSSGLKGLLFGVAMFFVVRVVCRLFLGETLARWGLTAVAILVLVTPEVWALLFPPETSLTPWDVAYSPAALALAIKTKLIAGAVGHAIGWIVQDKLLD